jgi:hypothetical protein
MIPSVDGTHVAAAERAAPAIPAVGVLLVMARTAFLIFIAAAVSQS